MNKQDLRARMINGTQKCCWCPMCEQDGKRAKIFGAWIVKTTLVFVCSYGVCEECLTSTMNAPQRLRTKLLDNVEQSLAKKYPQVWSKLPPDYFSQSSQPTPPSS